MALLFWLLNWCHTRSSADLAFCSSALMYMSKFQWSVFFPPLCAIYFATALALSFSGISKWPKTYCSTTMPGIFDYTCILINQVLNRISTNPSLWIQNLCNGYLWVSENRYCCEPNISCFLSNFKSFRICWMLHPFAFIWSTNWLYWLMFSYSSKISQWSNNDGYSSGMFHIKSGPNSGLLIAKSMIVPYLDLIDE